MSSSGVGSSTYQGTLLPGVAIQEQLVHPVCVRECVCVCERERERERERGGSSAPGFEFGIEGVVLKV